MSVSKRLSRQKEWEQALIDAYYDYRWRQVPQPLHDDFQRWAAGELSHADMNEAIHQTDKKNRELYNLFAQSRKLLIQVIQFDDEWFHDWVKDHPPPSEMGQLPINRPE